METQSPPSLWCLWKVKSLCEFYLKRMKEVKFGMQGDAESILEILFNINLLFLVKDSVSCLSLFLARVPHIFLLPFFFSLFGSWVDKKAKGSN